MKLLLSCFAKYIRNTPPELVDINWKSFQLCQYKHILTDFIYHNRLLQDKILLQRDDP